MLNKKALEAAALAICAVFKEEPEGKRVFQNLDGEVVTETFLARNQDAAAAAIEVFHAALPDDEDGLVKGLRHDAKALRMPTWHLPVHPDDLEAADRFDKAADALEAARAKLGIDKPRVPEV